MCTKGGFVQFLPLEQEGKCAKNVILVNFAFGTGRQLCQKVDFGEFLPLDQEGKCAIAPPQPSALASAPRSWQLITTEMLNSMFFVQMNKIRFIYG